MVSDNFEDNTHAIPLDRQHLVALVFAIIVCGAGGVLLSLATGFAVSFWQTFMLVAFLELGMVCLYRGSRCLSAYALIQRRYYWHRNRDIITGLMWLSVTGALLVVWISGTLLSPSLSAVLMAGFCLGACFALVRFVILVISPLSLPW